MEVANGLVLRACLFHQLGFDSEINNYLILAQMVFYAKSRTF
jgi:hypothetical protein